MTPPAALNRAWWNFQKSIAYDGAIADLDSLTFEIVTDVGPNLPAAPSVDLLAIRGIIDSRNSQPNATAGYADLYQTSQNPEFGWFAPTSDTDANPNGAFDYDQEGAWRMTLRASEAGYETSVSICVHTPGAQCVPVGGCCTNGPGTDSECIVTDQVDCEANHSLFLGGGTDCAGVDNCTLLAVTMETMSATATRGGVRLHWTTLTEIDTVGFRVLRELPGTRNKAPEFVSSLIPAAGNGFNGATYEFLDNSKLAGSAVRYFVEDVDIHGKRSLHGPIEIERPKPGRDASRTRRN